MIKDIRNTIKQTFLYGLSNIAVKAAGLVVLPFYTNSLTSSEYGELAMLEIMAQFFVGVISLQLPSAFLRFGGSASSSDQLKKIYSTALQLALLLAIGFVCLALLAVPSASQLIFGSNQFEIHLQLLTASIALEVLGLLPLQLLRLKEKSIFYLFFVAVRLICLVFFVWYFVVLNDQGVLGAIKAICLSNLLYLISTVPLQLKNIRLQFDRTQAKEFIAYGGPLIFTTVSAVMLTISDRFIIKVYGEFSDVGIYTLAYKVGSLSNLLIIASFSLGFLPIAFRKMQEAGFKDFFSKTLTLYTLLTIALTLFLSIFGLELIQMFSSGNESYETAAVLVPFIAFMFIFKALNNYFSYVFLLVKKTKYHAQVTIGGVVLNIALNFILVADYGMYGAVAATGISYICMSIFSHWLSQKQMRIKFEYKRIFLLLISSIVAVSIGLMTNDLGLLLRVLIKSAISVIWIAFVYKTLLAKSEKERISKVLALAKTPGGIQELIKQSIKD
ncbi:MAG: polysaccharide biosynthesis C-terminal domain-containing protein [Flavobacteriales bacterium]|nr:polysaccharide biosynthesis C-terminal domain-containing protein [Flavobacteriales bacterium]